MVSVVLVVIVAVLVVVGGLGGPVLMSWWEQVFYTTSGADCSGQATIYLKSVTVNVMIDEALNRLFGTGGC